MTDSSRRGRGARASRWKGIATGLIGVGLAATVTACAERDASRGPAPAKIRAVVLPFLAQSAFYIAADEGYFEEQNLDVEFVRLARNVEALPALARGEVDIGFSQLTIPLVNAIASGARMKLVAGLTYLARGGCTVNGVAARRDLVESGRLTRPEDLVGLKVELDVLLPAAYYVERLLQPAGLTIDDLDVVNLPPPSNVDALIRGSIDVTVATEPHLTRMVESGEAVVWRASQEILPDFQVSWLVFGPTLLDERPEVGERFMVAYRKAMRQYELGKTQRNLEILARGTHLPLDVLRDTCWPALRPEGRVATEGSMAFQEWLASRGLIDRVVPEAELTESRFIEHANAVLER